MVECSNLTRELAPEENARFPPEGDGRIFRPQTAITTGLLCVAERY